jgi:hypothetical protein
VRGGRAGDVELQRLELELFRRDLAEAGAGAVGGVVDARGGERPLVNTISSGVGGDELFLMLSVPPFPMPPATPLEVLLTIVLLLISAGPLLKIPPPTPTPPLPVAWLLEIVLLVSVSVLPPAFRMPPPSPLKSAVLPERVERRTVSVPSLLIPPAELALLPETVHSMTVSVPELRIPPPTSLTTRPLATVRPEIVAVTPPLIKKTREALLPLTVSRWAPGPWSGSYQ